MCVNLCSLRKNRKHRGSGIGRGFSRRGSCSRARGLLVTLDPGTASSRAAEEPHWESRRCKVLLGGEGTWSTGASGLAFWSSRDSELRSVAPPSSPTIKTAASKCAVI